MRSRLTLRLIALTCMSANTESNTRRHRNSLTRIATACAASSLVPPDWHPNAGGPFNYVPAARVDAPAHEGWTAADSIMKSPRLKAGQHSRPQRKLFCPFNSPGHLHHSKQSHDRTDGDRQPGEALKEERVRKQHQVNQLRNPR